VHQLYDPDELLAQIDHILHQTGLPGRCLMLEITEGMLIGDFEAAEQLLHELKKRSIQISIDDFGTGYSSLSYLHRLPIDRLKIDKSFIHQMQHSDRNHKIVETIITLADQLELDAIAEGIETTTQLAQLRQMNCEYGQGYFFARPLAATTVLPWLQSRLALKSAG
jgi:EAL domain-containing protein (putative c-di-GMP-specific phosphodiesterase class I)